MKERCPVDGVKEQCNVEGVVGNSSVVGETGATNKVNLGIETVVSMRSCDFSLQLSSLVLTSPQVEDDDGL